MSGRHSNLLGVFLTAFAVVTATLTSQAWAQQHVDRVQRELVQSMLNSLASDLRQYYYDPKFHGVDLEAKILEAKERIAQAPTYDDAAIAVAALFEALNDSHTFYVSPGHYAKLEYGWRYQMIGNRCFVTQVKPRSDAESKGVKPGDQVLTLEGFEPSRDGLRRMQYAINNLTLLRSLSVNLLDPARKVHKVEIVAKQQGAKEITDGEDMTGGEQWRRRLDFENEMHLLRVRYREFGDDLLIVKLPEFVQAQLEVHELLSKAKKHKSLILDLRGSPGGSEETLQYMLGGLLDKEVKIADRIARKNTKPLLTKGDHRDGFTGNLIVLVDSESASASELLARTVQLQKRGTVMGDLTSGATMEAEFYRHHTGGNRDYYYGAEITVADLVLPDGKRLEGVGVTPDVLVAPTADDMANQRDPVLSRAAGLVGVGLSPQEAGKLFSFEWPSR